jgi:hypothetical protein
MFQIDFGSIQKIQEIAKKALIQDKVGIKFSFKVFYLSLAIKTILL